MVDAVADVADIADALEIDQFAIVGRSAGAPHALACAARLAGRVTAAASLVGLAPRDRMRGRTGFDWFAGMTAENRRAYELLEQRPDQLELLLAQRAGVIGSKTSALTPIPDEGLHACDRRIIGTIRSSLDDTYRAALPKTENWYGWLDDLIALGDTDGWGFDLEEIKVPVLLWHGAEDQFSPVSHTQWLADHLPTALVSIESEASHFSAMEKLPELLPRLLALAELPIPVR